MSHHLPIRFWARSSSVALRAGRERARRGYARAARCAPLLGLLGCVAVFGSGCRSSCEPACRAGFACVEGRCVSECNPPCAPGETCTPERECLCERERERRAQRESCGQLERKALAACARLEGDTREMCEDGIRNAGYDRMDGRACASALEQLEKLERTAP